MKDCAEIYYLYKENFRYDRLGYGSKYLIQVGDKIKITSAAQFFPHYVIYIGFFFHILQIRFSESNMLVAMMVMNVLFSIP